MNHAFGSGSKNDAVGCVGGAVPAPEKVAALKPVVPCVAGAVVVADDANTDGIWSTSLNAEYLSLGSGGSTLAGAMHRSIIQPRKS